MEKRTTKSKSTGVEVRDEVKARERQRDRETETKASLRLVKRTDARARIRNTQLETTLVCAG